MRQPLRSVVVLALAVMAALFAAPGTAAAVPIEAAAPPTTVGYDVSHPQCGTTLPVDRAFAVVGVNGGLATRPNPCLATQLGWAWRSSGAVGAQPEAQLYLNTANPGQALELVTTWPTRGATPYGSCDGANSMACSWQYGRERARHSVDWVFTPAAREARVDGRPGQYTWWLDVETMNTWQSGSTQALARNRATLEGMTAYLESRGAKVGLYSTARQWGQIVGTVGPTSNLAGRNSWLAGSTTLAGAMATCEYPALVPRSRVTLSQYVVDDLDRNYSCR